ncbi:MAG TPA: ABC transporter ATP-binding protein, partial [Phycisphaerae bacterium]|nr:ABC transporter ATP-binding protein [Phycisphaerae bacterium]
MSFESPKAQPVAPAPAARPRDEIAVAVRDLGKCYGIYPRPMDRLKRTLWRGRRRFCTEFWALRNVSFDLRRGEAIGVIGRNGSGKSTLLQMIAGTLRPTEGEIEVRGRVAAMLELGSGFNPEFTGRENIYLNGSILGLSISEIDRRFDEIAAFADIGAFLDQPVKTYSTGMLVRVAFAVQTVLEPDVLIVDEALAVGDAAFQIKCMTRMSRLLDKGVSVLLVTHDV